MYNYKSNFGIMNFGGRKRYLVLMKISYTATF